MEKYTKRGTDLNSPHFSDPVTSTDSPRAEKINRLVFWSAIAVVHVSGLLCLILMIVWMVHFGKGMSWTKNRFNYHPLFMMIGLIYLNGNSLLVYRTFPNLPKLYTKAAHGIMHSTSLIFIITALYAIFKIKRVHLMSLHSWIGMSAAVVYTIQLMVGFLTFALPRTPAYWRAKILPFHTYIGACLLVISIGAALTGLMTNIGVPGYINGTYPATAAVGNCIGLFMIIYGLAVLFLLSQDRYKRLPLSDELPSLPRLTTVPGVN